MIRDTSAQDRLIEPAPGRRRKLLLIGGVAAVLVAGVLAWPGLQRMVSTNASVSETRLSIAEVERGPFVRDVAGEGKVVAANAPTLYAANGGTVTLRVHAGDKVAKGQVLAEIDSPELAARLAQERSNAEAMRAELMRAQVEARQQNAALQRDWENATIDLKTAQNDLDRQTQAFKAGAAASMQVDHARDTLEKARLTLAHANAGRGLKEDALKFEVQSKQAALERQQSLVKDLQRQVAELQLRSPVEGQVGQLLVAERATVAKDAQLLTVIDLSALEVQMQVAESFARDLAIGMPGEISGGGRAWRGLISSVSPEVVNGEVAARLRFDGEPPDQLRQNQRLSVRVLLDRRDNVLTVRRGGFADEGGGAHAYVLREGMAERVPVRLGARSLDKIEVLDGLKPGDKVIVSGAEAFNGAPRVAISR
ncbi:efflux RND transporter periplasmic adaptor subunit [Roseateles violae]|uniref:Efflux RND transporter periplasmic adaptor subunit n=1 Tax=Roseateles violae TaxID=3058042 RepID=A0ABT8DNQ3_9BURK|nr:efflux RND transporter periplasmic adaptor subunit [Pelomonas sp. PFR6]MDN3919626.1 efflux RND transporter periplasmic adaptor subunit [Pelomonas sp. PFR6]